MIKTQELPDGWEIVELKAIFEIKKGKKVKIEETVNEKSIPYIGIGNLRGDPIVQFTNDEKGLFCEENDILLVWDGANCGTVGYGLSGYVGSTITRLRLINDTSDSDYILHFLKSKFHYFNSNTTGATIPHLDKKRVHNLKIPLPPLPTQKKIVAILEKAEKLKGWRREADELTDELLKSTFFEMFGDPVKNPKGWKIVNLKTVFSTKKTGTKCGPFGSALKKYEYVNDGVPVWIMDNICENKFVKEGCLYITKEKYEKLKAYSVEQGDILISRAGTVGKMCVANPSTQQSIISTNLIRLSLDSSKIEPIYFICLMTYFKGKMGRLKTGEDGAYTFMNTGILKELSIPLPPIKLQNKFIRLFEELEQIQKNQTQSNQYIEDLFNALMQQAFSGELT